METKNVIGVISDGYYADEWGYYNLTVIDSESGEKLFTISDCKSVRSIKTKTDEITLLKIDVEYPPIKARELVLKIFRSKLDEEPHETYPSIGWVKQTVSLCEKKGKVRFKRGNKDLFKKLVDGNIDIRVKSYTNKSSYYDGNIAYLKNTIKLVTSVKRKIYDRREDYFASQCQKELGLPFRRYKAIEINDLKPKDVVAKICNDLGFNLLNVVSV